jgi:rod shape determining protein RodA
MPVFLKKIDWIVLLSAVLLIGIGLLVLGSASANQPVDFAHKQLVWVLAGIPIILICAFIPPSIWFSTAWFFYGFTIALLLFVKIAGAIGMGAERWIAVGSMRFQPSEMGKLALVLATARFLADNRVDLKQFRYILGAISLTAVPMLLVLAQPDLGTGLIYIFIMLPMLMRAGLPWTWLLFLLAPVIAAILSTNIFLLLLFILGLGALLYTAEVRILLMSLILSISAGIGFTLPLFWSLLQPYQQKRILIFLNPESDPLGSGYQIIQSKVAVGSGGLLGKGYMAGSQTQLDFLPERHTDFIFSVLAEEFGFIGCLLVIGLFTMLIMRLVLLGLGHRNSFCAIALTGFASIFFFHVLVNIGMTLGIMPVTGLPLTFITYGGSFMWTNLLIIGIVLKFSWHRRDGLTW